MSNNIDTNQTIYSLKSSLPTFTHINEIEHALGTRFKDFAFTRLRDIPHPKELYNNMEASLLVCESMLRGDKIVIVGDYDTDGVCATCIMLDFFEQLSYTNIFYAIPNRFKHGYGFSKKLFHEIISNHPDVRVIITVDNGVSSFEAGDLCREHNIHFIITDHHTLEVDSNQNPKIPACDFLINPQQKHCNFPYKDICGSLVAFYFCYAIKINMQMLTQDTETNHKYKINTDISKIDMYPLLLLVGIAIIADVMPLNAINHTICGYTIRRFKQSKRCAFKIFKEFSSSNINSQTLGFIFIPLLNSAGRIDDGNIALSFLRATSLDSAKFYFNKLQELNKKRKNLQEEATKQVYNAIKQRKQNENMLCAVGNDWHEGVLGIIAGKMADEFKKPCFVLTNINGVCKGSGRSYGNVDLIASMQRIGHLMKRYGGHVGAVGLEIEHCNIESFVNDFKPILYEGEKKESIISILQPHLITYNLLECINNFEPYGNGNPLPKFFIEMPIISTHKTERGYIEFTLQSKKRSIKAMLYDTKYAHRDFTSGDILQFRATIGVDSHYKNKAKRQNYKHSTKYFHIYREKSVMLIIDKIYGLQDNPI